VLSIREKLSASPNLVIPLHSSLKPNLDPITKALIYPKLRINPYKFNSDFNLAVTLDLILKPSLDT